MNILLVRHADAGDRHGWAGDDRSRPLNTRGRAQAAGLVTRFEARQIDRVMSSPYLRCLQTVEPLATARALSVEAEPLLAEGSDWRQALDLICQSLGPAVMCSQGDVIGDIVSHLVDGGQVNPGAARSQKGSTWVLEVRDGAINNATYLPPLEE